MKLCLVSSLFAERKKKSGNVCPRSLYHFIATRYTKMENTLVTYRRLSTCMPATRVQMKVSDKSVLIKFPLVKISYSTPIKL